VAHFRPTAIYMLTSPMFGPGRISDSTSSDETSFAKWRQGFWSGARFGTGLTAI
jgi:hypothetical protein